MSLNQNTSRLFIAIKLYPDPAFDLIVKNIRLKLREEKIRWIRRDNLHLTIRFLGETENNKLPLITEKLKELALQTRSFPLSIKGLGVFRSFSYPKVLWAGVKNSIPLIELNNKVDKALNSIDYQFTSDNYRPHLTLGRMRSIQNRNEFREVVTSNEGQLFLKQDVESVVLFESILKNDGPEYFPVSEHFFL
ncbi:MAG: RNA 2',3'-cyclic phosphodiesterase [Bacteroidales bacterium]|nr:RNA 2',3'-cyclic phosphodiesterase [Bacteroidales bacterium]